MRLFDNFEAVFKDGDVIPLAQAVTWPDGSVTAWFAPTKSTKTFPSMEKMKAVFAKGTDITNLVYGQLGSSMELRHTPADPSV